MTDTREQILSLAEALIRTKGYHGFSYRDIAAPLSIKNAAVHYYFPSKADLGVAIIKQTRKRLDEQIMRWAGLSPREKLKAFIDIYKESLSQNKVCFMGALGPSYDALPDSMKSELAIAGDRIRLRLREILAEGQAIGQLNFVETVAEKADMIITSLLSALVLSKVTDDDVLQSVSNAIIKTV